MVLEHNFFQIMNGPGPDGPVLDHKAKISKKLSMARTWISLNRPHIETANPAKVKQLLNK